MLGLANFIRRGIKTKAKKNERQKESPLVLERKFREAYIAERPVDLEAVEEFRGDAFPISGPACWLDRPNALLEVERRHDAGELSDDEAAMCKQWIFEGYYIAPGLIEAELLDRVWTAYEKAIAEGTITAPAESRGPEDIHPGRTLDPHIPVPILRELQQHPRILRISDVLFGRKTLPFQTIMGHKGSWQSPHSDTIHMTTYPLGYMLASWIAFEDVGTDCGPLEYYPRSHKLVPPLLSGELGIPPRAFKENMGVYSSRYEPTIRHYIDMLGLEPKYFLAKAGDVLFWHADLLHGGSPRKDLKLSRKAMVCHYFAQGAFTYHDLSGNATRLHKNGLYAPPAIDEHL
ncbi:phytanoyl-CoA dioxygenase family protein [Labrys sp. 22185]|uniref:phytanoyl-CoA dioxygenase family protein n=1 Tax=Labrys sp. 22185 TaxID=3453888 RepID=UPI003F85AFC3